MLDTAVRNPTAAAVARQSVLGRDWQLGYLFALPVLAVIVGLIAYPLGYSVWLSLNEIKLGGQGTFVGMNNYYKCSSIPTPASTTRS
jgi:multiple sugar transport system permease protein